MAVALKIVGITQNPIDLRCPTPECQGNKELGEYKVVFGDPAIRGLTTVVLEMNEWDALKLAMSIIGAVQKSRAE